MKNVFKKAGVFIAVLFTGFVLWIFRRARNFLLHDGNGTDGITIYNARTGKAINSAGEEIKRAEKRSESIMDGLTECADELSGSAEKLRRADEIIEGVKKRGKKKNY